MRIMRAWLAMAAVITMSCDGAGEATQEDAVQLMDARDAATMPSPPPAPAPTGEQSRAGAIGGAAGSAKVAVAFSHQGPGQAQLPGVASSRPPGSTAPAMIIRMGHATVEVDSLEPAVKAVQALALRVGGYVANISMHTGRSQLRQATLEMKVPAARFDEALEGLEPVGKLEALEMNAQDVGEEYADIAARMSNARRLEERLLTLLATRTGRLEDILAAERELARVREEIERYEGRLRYLQSRVSLSTLNITVHEPAPILGRTARNPIVDAFRDAWRNFVGFVAGLIELMGILIPLAAIVLGLALAWRRWGPRFGGTRGGESAA